MVGYDPPRKCQHGGLCTLSQKPRTFHTSPELFVPCAQNNVPIICGSYLQPQLSRPVCTFSIHSLYCFTDYIICYIYRSTHYVTIMICTPYIVLIYISSHIWWLISFSFNLGPTVRRPEAAMGIGRMYISTSGIGKTRCIAIDANRYGSQTYVWQTGMSAEILSCYCWKSGWNQYDICMICLDIPEVCYILGYLFGALCLQQFDSRCAKKNCFEQQSSNVLTEPLIQI